MMNSTTKLRGAGGLWLGAALLICGALAITPAQSRDARLEGSWSGGGKIVFPSGETEQARCRVSIRRQGGRNFGFNAICATPSARVQQSAALIHVAGNRYRGEFVNQEYGITGSIRLTLDGNRISASLTGGGGSAQLALRR